MQFTVRELMSSEPTAVPQGETIESALWHLLDCDAAELYVVDESRRLLGVVPDFALLKARLLDVPATEPVERIMIAGVATVGSATLASEVAPLFREGRCRQMPVVDAGILVGQVSRREILWMLRMTDAVRVRPSATILPESVDGAVVPAPRYLQAARPVRSSPG